jgi:hypothetical protein
MRQAELTEVVSWGHPVVGESFKGRDEADELHVRHVLGDQSLFCIILAARNEEVQIAADKVRSLARSRGWCAARLGPPYPLFGQDRRLV